MYWVHVHILNVHEMVVSYVVFEALNLYSDRNGQSLHTQESASQQRCYKRRRGDDDVSTDHRDFTYLFRFSISREIVKEMTNDG